MTKPYAQLTTRNGDTFDFALEELLGLMAAVELTDQGSPLEEISCKEHAQGFMSMKDRFTHFVHTHV